jgi:hypothetical protein
VRKIRGEFRLCGMPMRINLPTPPRGWREFYWELVIIVIGVLIALWAQQLAESLDDRGRAARARENIRAEISNNLGRMEKRMQLQDCVHRRLDEIAAYLKEKNAGGSPQALRWIGRPSVWVMPEAQFQSAVSAGRISLLPAEEQSDYSVAYSSIREFRANEEHEQAAWAQLRALAGLTRLSEAQEAVFWQALQSARYSAWRLQGVAQQLKAFARSKDIEPASIPGGSVGICFPSDTPADVANARLPRDEPQ